MADFEVLHRAASSPETWAGHPANNRYERTVFEPYFEFLLKNGGTLVVEDAGTGTVIGCSRYYSAPDRPESLSIGFTFLDHRYWGGTTNFEMKRLMLGHAFETFNEVWFHIASTNVRSQKATAKLGAEHVYDAVLNLSGAAVEWMCFRLRRDTWQQVYLGRKA